MPFNPIDLSGRTALITGAASGIGFGVAQSLIAAGASVAVNDIDAKKASNAVKRLGENAFALPGDIACTDEVKTIVGGAAARSGKLDILVNNAGVSQPPVSLRSLHVSDWQRVIDVNLRGAFLASQAAAHHMIEDGAGSIVNISSVTGLAPFPASNAYGVSKAGVGMLTQTLALELARHGVRVNAVAPGVIDAPMLRTLAGDGKELESVRRRVPLGRLGQASEIGLAVAFLCSEAASYITGAVLPVDGGWVAYGGIGPASRLQSADLS